MSEGNPWSRLMEDWEVIWVKPTVKMESDEPPFPHAFFVTRSKALELLLRANTSEQQVKREIIGLLHAINEGLLDDLEHDIPPARWLDLDPDE